MSTLLVKHNVNKNVKIWKQALNDTEAGLSQADKEAARWRRTVQIIRNKIANRAAWPDGQKTESQPNATRISDSTRRSLACWPMMAVVYNYRVASSENCVSAGDARPAQPYCVARPRA